MGGDISMLVIMVKAQGKATNGWPEAIDKSDIVYPHQGCLKAVS